MAMFVGLTILACFMRQSLTMFTGALCTLFMMILTLFIVNLFIQVKILYLCIIGLVIVLLSVFIVWDTQMIVGGRHKKYQLEMDDYVIGAMIIYSDIITLFLYVLQLFGSSGN